LFMIVFSLIIFVEGRPVLRRGVDVVPAVGVAYHWVGDSTMGKYSLDGIRANELNGYKVEFSSDFDRSYQRKFVVLNCF